MWTPIAAPPTLRPTVTAYQHSLLSTGGVKGGLPQEAIYRFDGKFWANVGSMSVGRYRHGVVPYESHGAVLVLFVAGGYVRSDPLGDEANVKSPSAELVYL